MQINEQEKSPIKQRILQYLDYKGVSRYKFYKESGITRGVLDQNTGISEDTLLKFLMYAREISFNWILFGKGEMIPEKQDIEGELSKNSNSPNMFDVAICNDADFFATVRGDYMSPKYSNGDIVACKKLSLDTFFFSHRIYLLKTEQGEIVTKVEDNKENPFITAYSDNTEFKPTEIPRDKISEISIVLGVIKIE